MPFFRFGFPVTILSIKNKRQQDELIFNLGLIQLALIIVSQLTIFIDFFLHQLLVYSIIAAMFFNFGALLIRKGKRLGFGLQNGILYLFLGTQTLLIYLNNTLFAPLIFLSLFSLFSILFFLFSYWDRKILNLDNFKIINAKAWFLDTLTAFYVPLVTLLSINLLAIKDAKILLLLKLSAFISGAIGALILLAIKRLDKVSKQQNLLTQYFSIKKRIFPVLAILIFVINTFILVLEPELFIYSVCFSLIEIGILFYGHFNILLNYKNLLKESIYAIFATAILASCMYLLLQLLNIDNSTTTALSFYMISIASYHSLCRIKFINHNPGT